MTQLMLPLRQSHMRVVPLLKCPSPYAPTCTRSTADFGLRLEPKDWSKPVPQVRCRALSHMMPY